MSDNSGKSFDDGFRDGALDASGKPVVFLDPNVEGDPALEDIERLRQGFFNVIPDSAKEILPGRLSFFIEQAQGSQPFARIFNHRNSEVCLINPRADNLSVEALIQDTLTQMPSGFLKDLPGSHYHWGVLIGRHEGEHCNQVFPTALGLTDLNARMIYILGMEVEADRAALAWLRKNGHAEIAQAFQDYRALGADGGPSHATGIFLSQETTEKVTPLHFDAAKNFKEAMFSGVADELRITVRDAEILLREDPQKFLGVVKEQLANGTYEASGNPHIAQYIADYAGAYERRVFGAAPASEITAENTISSTPSFSGPR
jgi:hypothetical protein